MKQLIIPDNLIKIKDNYRKIVVTMYPFSGNTIQGIEHLPIRAFLTSEISVH